ncbi:MAG: hypothetical protein NTZ10_00105 [Candidatus Saganbacteria bacterium]|nr:hypothetical protein [Candidatus Saganbacteria bacterium]
MANVTFGQFLRTSPGLPEAWRRYNSGRGDVPQIHDRKMHVDTAVALACMLPRRIVFGQLRLAPISRERALELFKSPHMPGIVALEILHNCRDGDRPIPILESSDFNDLGLNKYGVLSAEPKQISPHCIFDILRRFERSSASSKLDHQKAAEWLNKPSTEMSVSTRIEALNLIRQTYGEEDFVTTLKNMRPLSALEYWCMSRFHVGMVDAHLFGWVQFGE